MVFTWSIAVPVLLKAPPYSYATGHLAQILSGPDSAWKFFNSCTLWKSERSGTVLSWDLLIYEMELTHRQFANSEFRPLFNFLEIR